VSLVLDTSLALSWYFEDERTPAADALLDRVADQGATVPGLWRLEIANGLRTAIRRKRIDEGFRNRAIAQLARLPINVDPDRYACTTSLYLVPGLTLTVVPGVMSSFPTAQYRARSRRRATARQAWRAGASDAAPDDWRNCWSTAMAPPSIACSRRRRYWRGS
jgi:hypothetical protein